MPRIEFLGNEFGAGKVTESPGGAELVDVCDAVLAPIPFSCRSASCATCQIEVVEGMELLETPEDMERELLDVICAPPNHRLACQVRIKAGEGLIRVKAAG